MKIKLRLNEHTFIEDVEFIKEYFDLDPLSLKRLSKMKKPVLALRAVKTGGRIYVLHTLYDGSTTDFWKDIDRLGIMELPENTSEYEDVKDLVEVVEE